MADRTTLEARWDEMKGRITEAWGALTDDDMQRMEGRWDQVVATIRRRTGESIEKIEEKLDDIFDSRSSFQSDWNEMKGRITEAWGALTDDDMQRMEGRWDSVVATIEQKTDESVETIESKLDEMIDSLERDSVSS